jgi:hypothetical protein
MDAPWAKQVLQLRETLPPSNKSQFVVDSGGNTGIYYRDRQSLPVIGSKGKPNGVASCKDPTAERGDAGRQRQVKVEEETQ